MNTELKVTTEEKLPAYLSNYSNDGADDVQEEASFSYIKCCQSMSQEVSDGSAKPGDFYDTGSQENLGRELDVIIVKTSKTWVKFDEESTIKSTEGITWSDGTELTEVEMWQCAQYEFYVVLKDNMQPLPAVLPMKSTSFKSGRKLINMLSRFTNIKREPVYARSYKISAEQTKNDKGSFYVIKADLNDGYNSSEEVAFASKVRGGLLTVDAELNVA